MIPAPWAAQWTVGTCSTTHSAPVTDVGRPLVGMRLEAMRERGGPSKPLGLVDDALDIPVASDPCPAKYYECPT